MEWEWDTGVMDWEVDNAVADWQRLTNPSPDRQNEPSYHSPLSVSMNSQSRSYSQDQQDLDMLDRPFETGDMEWQVEDEAAARRTFTNVSPDRQSQRDHNSPLASNFQNQSAGANQNMLDYAIHGMDVEDTAVQFDDTLLDLDNAAAQADDTAMEVNETVLDYQPSDATDSSFGAGQHLPQVPESQDYIFPQGQGFIRMCTLPGCTEFMVDGLHCEYHKQQQVLTPCNELGCSSWSITDGYCIDHWIQARGPEPDKEEPDCQIAGCINKSEFGSVLCTGHNYGGDLDDESYRRRKCEYMGCIAQKRKGAYCVTHWNELNPHSKLCSHARCANIRSGQGLYCGRHMKQKDLVQSLPKYSARDGCSYPECSNRRWKHRLCERHWRLKDQGVDSSKPLCTTPDCEKIVWRKSLCYHHAAQMGPEFMLCEAPGCTDNKRIGGYCQGHSSLVTKICTSTECENKAWRKSLCYQHAREEWPGLILCEFPGCTNRKWAQGLCEKHSEKTRVRREYLVKVCTVPECENNAFRKTVCYQHAKERWSEDLLCQFPGCTHSKHSGGFCRKHGEAKVCTVTECEKTVWGKTLCYQHMREIWPETMLCQFPDCTHKKQIGGFCEKHGGTRVCEATDCEKKTWRKTLCYQHAREMWPEAIHCQFPYCTRTRQKGGFCEQHGEARACTVTECEKKAWKKTLCFKHAKEMWPETLMCQFPECTRGARIDGFCQNHSFTPSP